MAERSIAFWKGMFWITLAYVAALLGGVVVAHVLGVGDPFWDALIADVVATVIVFGFSFAFNNSSFYDPYWSVVPPVIVGYWIFWPGAAGDPIRQALLLAGVVFWATRLTMNWASYWDLHHEDWRYTMYRPRTGLLHWPFSLASFHMFPTLLVFLALWPAYLAATSTAPFGFLDVVATAVCFGATFLEGVADTQLARFRQSAPLREAYIDEGLWRWSRHPNYLGEILFWCGLWVFAVAADPKHAVSVLGVVGMAALFRFVSIPMMEKRTLVRRPRFADQIQRVPMILPWPPRHRAVDWHAVAAEVAAAAAPPIPDQPTATHQAPAAPLPPAEAPMEPVAGPPGPDDAAPEAIGEE